MTLNKWSDDTPRINQIDVLEIVPKYGIIRACWRADRIRQLRGRTLDEIHPAAGRPGRPKHPNKAPQRTLSDRVLEAGLRATDPADAAPAAAPSIAPDRQRTAPTQMGSECRRPKTPRHGRKVAGDNTKAHSQRTAAKLGRSRCVHTTSHGATFLF